MNQNVTKSKKPPEQTQSMSDKPFCDVVMKGGITSGVVYPPAIVELAGKYRLKNIGGASAGAIAAGLAAAAEFNRDGGGFQHLDGLSDEVSTRLQSLFQPTPETRPVFEMLLASLGDRSKFRKVLGVLCALVRGYWVTSLLGSLLGIALLFCAWWHDDRWGIWLAGLLVWIIGCAVALGWRLFRVITRQLPRQNYGLCPGLQQPGYPREGLTEWLADKIDEFAGLRKPNGSSTKPLTFGDLIGDDKSNPNINLEMMTTNLTAGRPYRIPFDENLFMFREEDFKKLFPPRIVDWMVDHSNPYKDGSQVRWLPHKENLPVVVGVRMSLSFPILLAAVPLYAKDFTLRDKKEREVPKRCWFSDGGICSNFPIHFFDSVWPRWPTFGITLEPYLKANHKKRVELPIDARAGILKAFSPIDSIFGFLGAMIEAMQEWRDNLQSTLPGYRERIVHVRLEPEEGGLNLNMSSELIKTLAGLGQTAGEELLGEFEMDEHRWRRYLIWMAKLEGVMEGMAKSYTVAPPPDGENLKDFLTRYPAVATSYRQTTKWLDAAESNTREMMKLYEEWRKRPAMRDRNIPKPDVDMRLTPKV